MESAENSYVLNHHPRELARLVAYSEREAEDVRMVCRRAQLGPGMRAIDIGCGPLGALAILSEIVGPTGEVVGLDSSADAIAKANALIAHLGLRNVRLVHGDLNALDASALGSEDAFDFAYCRLVLLHQTSPASFLRSACALLKAGGHVAYQDIVDDPSYPKSEPELLAQTQAWRLVLALFKQRGISPEVARDHAALASAAGCELVHQRGKFPVLPAREGFEILQQLLTASRSHLADAGLASSETVDTLIAELETAKGGMFRYWHGPLAIETLALKSRAVSRA
jgi:SAM-dependent methyltransferase